MKFSWHDVAEDVEKHAHKLAKDIFALEPDVTEEVDLKALFARILWKEDWTDKLAAHLGRLKDLFHRPQNETPIPEDLKQLIPNMRDVERAYVEITSGYKDFIKAVWVAQHERQWRE
ncbi:MAG TPA: hypothetical protein VNA15_06820 [Candidatus Angelobacter sp.]|nr:hypothetical protein [Candidatus Angelobacter sp.]